MYQERADRDQRIIRDHKPPTRGLRVSSPSLHTGRAAPRRGRRFRYPFSAINFSDQVVGFADGFRFEGVNQ